uniref:EOG090X05H5 n=1 Tax=Daphnia sinensis TaxID=1820382 RepID=A0A4Y7NEW5_9CRUS|nr:EOG090X05H5 [Daphnia sinensis]
MRSQTTTNSRKRVRESADGVRSTRLKTGRHARPSLATELDMKMDDTDDEMTTILHLEELEEEEESFKKKKKMMMIKKNAKIVQHPAAAAVIGPPSDGSGSTEQDQPAVVTPSKQRKQSLLHQQQQQVANGFPVTVFPPADNNNSTPAGPFQQRLTNNNNNNKSKGVANSKPEHMKPAVVMANQMDKEAPPPSLSSSRRDEETAAIVAVTSAAASIRRQQMKDAFQPWVMQSSPFPGNGGNDPTAHDDLYVVTSTTKDEAGGEDRPVYKKVAVVEDFFDIIYREHVEFMSNSGGRPPTGKHAGQKRTYRARRGNGASSAANVILPSPSQLVAPASTPTPNSLLPNQSVSPGSPTPPASPHTPANVTATAAPATVKLHHHHHLPPTPPQSSRHSDSWSQQQHQLRLLGLGQATAIPPTPSTLLMGLAVTTNNIDLSLPLTSTLLKRATLAGVSHQQLLGLDRAESSFSSAGISSQPQGMTAGYPADHQEINPVSQQQYQSSSSSMSNCSATMTTAYTTTDPTSPITLDLSLSKTSTTDVAMCDDHSPNGTVKDEDDEDDDDVDDRIDTQQDPERLKAFNMFVRLFVDENLDRMVPISRQPREKIQAIIDSCLRQFPEFGERARKRIRTYLKSCRRHKRTRDDAPLSLAGALPSPNRPMPSHLTSVVAEQILAQACENENQNAKRLRLGLEPISQPLPPTNEGSNVSNSPTTFAQQSETAQSTQTIPTSSGMNLSSSQTTNLFRPAFGPYQRSSNNGNSQPTSSINQGPTDLSTKSRPAAILAPTTTNGLPSRSSPLQPHKLNAAEILTVRQLVTGYRESAAFLLRSADELEQLLHQQQSTN